MSALSNMHAGAAATAEEWDAHRTTMHNLYMVQNKPLKSVMHEMKEMHNFHGR